MLIPSPLFKDGCVLPMDKPIRVFGQTDARSITVQLTDEKGAVLSRTQADTADARFLCTLAPVQTPLRGCTLSIESENEAVTACNIAVGLVFLAGGQSNMELELQNADEGQALLAVHDLPDVRYFNVPKQAIWNDEAIQAEKNSHWEAVRPGHARDLSAVAYFFACKVHAALHCPIGIIDCYWGGTSITCWMDEEALLRTDEGRRYMDDWAQRCQGKTMAQYLREWDEFWAVRARWDKAYSDMRAQHPEMTWDDIIEKLGQSPWNPPVGPGSPFRPAGLAETMLKRVAPASLSGFLFYQGEEDTFRTEHYDQLLIQLVLRWRELFCDLSLPFLNVQLPMWLDRGAQDDGTWARTRLAQRKAHSMLQNAPLCCLIDCGEWNNIHPTDKRTPGERLAALYLDLIGFAPVHSPEAVCAWPEGDALFVRLSSPVQAKCGEPTLFEIRAADGSYQSARAELLSGGMCLRLTAPGVARPVQARYAHVAFARVNVFSPDGWPLAPFETALPDSLPNPY